MNKPALVAFALLCAGAADAQTTGRTARKSPSRPSCAPGAICFSGRVSQGQEFRRALTKDLEFVLQPGWTISIASTQPQGDCKELAWVVNAPYRAHNQLYINMTYGFTAEDEVAGSPREFNFVTNCRDYRTEADLVQIALWPYNATTKQVEEAMDKLGKSPLGKGRLWITTSKISHDDDTADDKLGKIEWMTFSVEIILPRA